MNSFIASIDFVSSWTTAWNSISAPLGSFTKFIGAIGALMVVAGVVGYVWERRRSGAGGNHQKLIWTIIIGAILSAPGVMIPVVLVIVDYIVNGIIAVLPIAGG
jgi:hypothetical protein